MEKFLNKKDIWIHNGLIYKKEHIKHGGSCKHCDVDSKKSFCYYNICPIGLNDYFKLIGKVVKRGKNNPCSECPVDESIGACDGCSAEIGYGNVIVKISKKEQTEVENNKESLPNFMVITANLRERNKNLQEIAFKKGYVWRTNDDATKTIVKKLDAMSLMFSCGEIASSAGVPVAELEEITYRKAMEILNNLPDVPEYEIYEAQVVSETGMYIIKDRAAHYWFRYYESERNDTEFIGFVYETMTGKIVSPNRMLLDQHGDLVSEVTYVEKCKPAIPVALIFKLKV